MGVILSFNENNNNTFAGSQTFHPVNSDAAITVVNDFLYNVNRTAGNFLFNDYGGNPSKPSPNSAIKAEIHLLDPGLSFPNQNASAIIANVTTTAGSLRGWPTVNGIQVIGTDVSGKVNDSNGIKVSTFVGPILGTAIGLLIEDQTAGTVANYAIKTGTGLCLFGADGYFVGGVQASNLSNQLASNNAVIQPTIAGTRITRNIGDANTCLAVNQSNAASTGLIVDFQFIGSTKASIDKTGSATFQGSLSAVGNISSLGANPSLSVNGNKGGGNYWLVQTIDADGHLRIYDVTNSVDVLNITPITGAAAFSGNLYAPLIKTNTYLVAGLPAGIIGQRAFVTNALAPAFGVAVAGGGAVGVPVYHDGTSWKVG